MIIRGWGGVLTSLTSTSLTLRNMYTLRMLLYDVVWSSGGWGGCINVLDEHFPYVTEHVHVAHAVVWSSGGWGGCINVLDEHFPYPYVTEHVHVAHAVVWSSGGWGGCICVLDDHFSDVMEHVAPQKNQQIYKKDTLRPPAGHGVTMLPCCSLWLLRCHKRSGTEASRRGKNWKSECRLDMIRMIENHRFLMFIFSPLKSKIESLRRRNANFHSWVTRLPIKMNVRPCCKHFWRLLQIPAFCILASKIRISNLSPLQGCRVNRLPSLAMFSSRFPPFFPIKKPGRAGRKPASAQEDYELVPAGAEGISFQLNEPRAGDWRWRLVLLDGKKEKGDRKANDHRIMIGIIMG